jgi:hypothetical protein
MTVLELIADLEGMVKTNPDAGEFKVMVNDTIDDPLDSVSSANVETKTVTLISESGF